MSCDILWKLNNRSFYSSFNECISKAISTSNIQNFRLEHWIFTEKNSLFLADKVTVIYQFFIEVIKLVVVCDHSYAWFRCKDLFGLDLKGERSWLPFIKETIVEKSSCFSFEDKRVWTCLKINNFFVFVEFVVSAAERGKLIITHNQRISSSSKNSSIIYTSTIDSAIVKQ